MRAAIVGLAFSIARPPGALRAARTSGDSTRATISCRMPSAPDQLALTNALAQLKPLLEDAARPQGRSRPEVRLRRPASVTASRCGDSQFDSMLASYLLDATRPGHPLEETSLEHLGYKALTEEELCGRGVKGGRHRPPVAGGGAELRRRARRPDAAAVQPARSAARDGRPRARVSRSRDAARSRAGRRRARRHPR